MKFEDKNMNIILKIKIKFLDKDEIKIFLQYVKIVYFPLMKLFIIRVKNIDCNISSLLGICRKR